MPNDKDTQAALKQANAEKTKLESTIDKLDTALKASRAKLREYKLATMESERVLDKFSRDANLRKSMKPESEKPDPNDPEGLFTGQ